MGMFKPSSSGGTPPPIPGEPSNLSPTMKGYLMPMETLMAMTGLDDKLKAKMGTQATPGGGYATQAPKPKQTDIGQNTIGIGNPSAMTPQRAR